MQTRIRVNKSLERDFKNEFWKGLSLKEVGCFAGALAVLAAAAVFSHVLFKTDYVAGVYIGIPFAFPIILLGFKKFHGMSLMKYLEVTKKKRDNPVLMRDTGMPEYRKASFHMNRPKTFAESRGFLYDFSPAAYRKEMIRGFPYSLKKPKEITGRGDGAQQTDDRTPETENKEGIIKMDKKHATILIIVIAAIGVLLLGGLGYAGMQVKEHWQEENQKWEYEHKAGAPETSVEEIVDAVIEQLGKESETETAVTEETVTEQTSAEEITEETTAKDKTSETKTEKKQKQEQKETAKETSTK